MRTKLTVMVAAISFNVRFMQIDYQTKWKHSTIIFVFFEIIMGNLHECKKLTIEYAPIVNLLICPDCRTANMAVHNHPSLGFRVGHGLGERMGICDTIEFVFDGFDFVHKIKGF